MQIGFIGLGNMGAPMARNLLEAGFAVSVHDVDMAKVSHLVAEGAGSGDTVAQLAGCADLVLTSLPGPTEVEAVGRELVMAMRAGTIWADLSTNDLRCARALEPLAAAAGVHLVDAPVTGGAEGAAAGTLTVLVGGDNEIVERCRRVLECIGDRVEHLGPHGAGYVAKIAQVSLCYVHSLGLAEALLLGARGGVDPERMLDVIQQSTGRSYVADRYGPEILTGGYDATFDLGLAAKDLRLAIDLARQVDALIPLTSRILEHYEAAVDEFGFEAPHLMAVHPLERDNDLILHQHGSDHEGLHP